MSEITRVARPPERPLAVFDGDCGFCRLWIARWKARTGPKVDYAPSQEVAERFPEIPKERFARAFQLILPDGEVLGGAEAVAALAGREAGSGPWLALYRRVPGAAPLAELAYRLIADHRPAAMAVTLLLWGPSVLKPTYSAATALFLRLLGLCYLAAFVSLWVQVDGLVGANGVLPIAPFLDWVRSQTGGGRYWLLPTLSWISSSDTALHLQCAAGTGAALLLLAGLAPAWSAAAAWLLYLSLSVAGQTFLEFQWDFLLTETGLLAIFLAPPSRLRLRAGLSTPRLARFLLVWLLFRLMLSSGAVKLGSGDAAWRSLTALRVHYETQPLPPWTAWFVHQLPAAFQTASCVFLFFVELAMPFLFFAPRRLRLFACGMTILLQVLIAATGNYAFFNLLTISLAILLLDDAAFPKRWRASADGRRLERGSRSLAAMDPRARGGGPPRRVRGAVSRLRGVAQRDPGRARVRLSRGGASPQRQRLRPLRGHDDGAARDRAGRERGRRDVEGLRVPVEARRSSPPAALRRAPSASPRLADVVRRARRLPRESLAREHDGAAA